MKRLGIAEGYEALLFDLLDSDDSGTIGADEFVDNCIKLGGATRAIDFAAFMIEFRDVKDNVDSLLRTKKRVSAHYGYLPAPRERN